MDNVKNVVTVAMALDVLPSCTTAESLLEGCSPKESPREWWTREAAAVVASTLQQCPHTQTPDVLILTAAYSGHIRIFQNVGCPSWVALTDDARK
jgi:hypothetical protein